MSKLTRWKRRSFSERMLLLFAWLTSGVALALILTMVVSLKTFISHPLGGADSRGVVRIGGLTQPTNGSAADYWNSNRIFDAMARYEAGTAAFAFGATGEAAPRPAAIVSVSFFDLLSVPLMCGRIPSEKEIAGGGANQLIVSARLLGRRDGCQTGDIGLPVRVDGQIYEIAAVIDGAFLFPAGAEIWIPQSLQEPARRVISFPMARVGGWLGKLAENATLGAAKSELTARLQQLNALSASDQVRHGDIVFVTPLDDFLTRDRRSIATLLGCGALLLGLIAGLNVAVLVYVNFFSRRKELAVRQVLGAQDKDIRRMFSRELVVWLIPGIGIGIAMLETVWTVIAPQMTSPYLAAPGNPMNEGWVGIVATVLFFGLLPLCSRILANRIGRFNPHTLREHSTGLNIVPPHLRAALVAGQIAATLVLAMFAFTALHKFKQLVTRPLGFNTDRIVFFERADLARSPYAEDIWRRAITTIQRYQSSAVAPRLAITTAVPFVDAGYQGVFVKREGSNLPFRLVACDAKFFQVLGIPFVAGRPFEASDRQVVILDAEGMSRLGLSSSDVGSIVTLDGEDAPRRIVGVVATTQDGTSPSQQRVYTPLDATYRTAIPNRFSIVGKCERSCEDEMRPMLSDIYSTTGYTKAQSLVSVQQHYFAPDTGKLKVLSLYAVIAMLISVLGVYGLVSQIALYRHRECLLRVALGATTMKIGLLLLRNVMASVFGGIGIGSLAAWMLLRLTQAKIYGLADLDPAAMLTSMIIVFLSALAAAALPIYRLCRYGLSPSGI